MDFQKMIEVMSKASDKERENYHLTFGQLIDALKNAPEGSVISPKITGIGAYRGYYSDMALTTETVGTEPMYTEDVWSDSDFERRKDYDALRFSIAELSEDPKELAAQFESMLGRYTDGYKRGCSLVTRETPMWIATDYGDCSGDAIVGISPDLGLVIKHI